MRGVACGIPSGTQLKESCELGTKLFHVSCMTLPHDKHTPTEPPQLSDLTSVPRDVSSALGFPELRTCCRRHSAIAAAMHVPEASMHEDYLVVPRKDQIRSARKVSAVQPKAKAERMDDSPDQHFRP